MKRLISVIGIMLIFIVIAHLYNENYHKRIKSSPKKYCYQTFFGVPNSALIIEDLTYKDSLIKYYEQMEDGQNPIFNFPLKTLPQYDPVYVVGYSSDSLLVKVVSYYNRGKVGGGSYLTGYVYFKTLHDSLPLKIE